MNKFKNGDLAIIIGSRLNEGAIVEVQCYTGPTWVSDTTWLCHNVRPMQGDMEDGSICRIAIGSPIYLPDNWLVPVSGLPLHDEESTDAPVPA